MTDFNLTSFTNIESEEIKPNRVIAQKLEVGGDFCWLRARGKGGGDSNIKNVEMLVVSLRGVNFRFWSRLGFRGKIGNIFSLQVSLRVHAKICSN